MLYLSVILVMNSGNQNSRPMFCKYYDKCMYSIKFPWHSQAVYKLWLFIRFQHFHASSWYIICLSTFLTHFWWVDVVLSTLLSIDLNINEFSIPMWHDRGKWVACQQYSILISYHKRFIHSVYTSTCCSQSKFRILKIRESSARALFLYNCTSNISRSADASVSIT